MIIDQIIKKVQENDPDANIELMISAYEFAESAHKGQLRQTGEPVINHALHTAHILAQIKADYKTVIAGLLHDIPEDTEYSLSDIKKKYGKEIAKLVEAVTKLSKIKYRQQERYVESLRKMFLAMAQDLRVILIKFADRLHNLRTLEALPEKKQERIAKETMEIYAPIAGLLGIWRLKWQMEDLCFKFLHSEQFKKLEYEYEVEKKVERNQFIKKVRKILEKELNKKSIHHTISGRFKHLYSIYKKMQNKDRKFNEIYDVFALRVLVDSVADCYKALGVIHSLWKPKSNRFKDYIALPKPNGYKSIHTTVFGPHGKLTEFQIRTKKMDEEALYGVAAHWSYKNSNDNKSKNPRWVKEILDIQRDAVNSQEFVNQIKFNVFKDRIFVFTPKGDVIDLPEGSTPIDFAYSVHTDIGNKAGGALINNKMATLKTELKNNDTVEIIIDKKRKGPNRDWIKIAKTHRARTKIRQSTKESRLEQIKKLIPYTN